MLEVVLNAALLLVIVRHALLQNALHATQDTMSVPEPALNAVLLARHVLVIVLLV